MHGHETFMMKTESSLIKTLPLAKRMLCSFWKDSKILLAEKSEKKYVIE